MQLLSSFVSSLSLPSSSTTTSDVSDDHPSILRRTVDELTQTVALMASENPDEFYDISQRNKKFGSVNAQNGAVLLEKTMRGQQEMQADAAAKASGEEGRSSSNMGFRGYEDARTKASERFGGMMRGFRRGGEGEK